MAPGPAGPCELPAQRGSSLLPACMVGMQPQVHIYLTSRPKWGDKGPASSLSQAGQDANEIVQPQQIAVLTVALLPGPPMIQDLAIGEGRGLAKIDEPDSGAVAMVMHEEE